VKTGQVRSPVLAIDDGPRRAVATRLVRRRPRFAVAGIVLVAALPVSAIAHGGTLVSGLVSGLCGSRDYLDPGSVDSLFMTEHDRDVKTMFRNIFIKSLD
jgi:hypothetical protein